VNGGRRSKGNLATTLSGRWEIDKRSWVRKRRSGTPRESCKIPGHADVRGEPTFSHAAWGFNWPIAVLKLAAVPLSVLAMIGVLPPRRCVAGGSSCYVLMGNVDRKGGGDA
jgi:hypothetical protein